MPVLANKDDSILMRGKLCRYCVQSCMLHGNEAWPVEKERVWTLAGWDEYDWVDVW